MTSDVSVLTPDLKQRVLIENVQPLVDAGNFPLKRCVRDEVTVQATILTDGMDQIAARIRYRSALDLEWMEQPLRLTDTGKDLWQGRFRVDILGNYSYVLEAWIDTFSTWRDTLIKKADANQDIEQDLREGALLIHAATISVNGDDLEELRKATTILGSDAAMAARLTFARQESLRQLMHRCANREPITTSPTYTVHVERPRARTGAWYEIFPRSAGETVERSATLREAETRLEGIARMGFDILYLPPVHPIGKSFRKGSNNNPESKPGDPGSPWAIGSKDGGHKSIDPALGTLADFDHFVKAANNTGLEVALDLAYQCSPDHPYAREHPEWFHHRPDGSIHYAENPPKKYEDIYPINFECEDWQNLWQELKSVVLFWIEHRIKIFRVDNPHTKPFRFWEWLIRDVQAQYPDAIFLGEAFTRPAGMDSLAKVGFSQSYTYFTWRNTKDELTEYLTELTQTDLREYLRPNFFVNTPDILPTFLQTGGAAAAQIRVVLAATLSASYGIYGPVFELGETRALPGTEEYADSEKFQIRKWDWNRPGSVMPLITQINRLRHQNAALQLNAGLHFYPIDNPMLLAYGKTTDDHKNQIVTIVNLDPFNTQSGWLTLPPEDFGLSESYQVHDLLTDQFFLWCQGRNFIKLVPQEHVAHVLKVPYASL